MQLNCGSNYSAFLPGYHMNKKHWNTIIVDGHLHQNQLKEFIKDSYTCCRQRGNKLDFNNFFTDF